MEKVVTKSAGSSRTRSIAFVGLTIAIIAVSAWITVPIGPVPFTLQMFALTFAIVVLSPKECVCAVGGYLVLGAIGLPVFSGMRGGIGVLAGPTGGFLWGYLLGCAAGALFLHVMRSRFPEKGSAVQAGVDGLSRGSKAALFFRNAGFEIAAGLIFTAVAYVCGWAQFMAVAGVSPEQAFLVAVAPFVMVDVAKIVAAVACARAVKAVVK